MTPPNCPPPHPLPPPPTALEGPHVFPTCDTAGAFPVPPMLTNKRPWRTRLLPSSGLTGPNPYPSKPARSLPFPPSRQVKVPPCYVRRPIRFFCRSKPIWWGYSLRFQFFQPISSKTLAWLTPTWFFMGELRRAVLQVFYVPYTFMPLVAFPLLLISSRQDTPFSSFETLRRACNVSFTLHVMRCLSPFFAQCFFFFFCPPGSIDCDRAVAYFCICMVLLTRFAGPGT